jgi:hypothetical protein
MVKQKRERDHMEPVVETARAWRQTGRGRAPPVAGERTPVARRGWKSARGWTPRAPAEQVDWSGLRRLRPPLQSTGRGG